MAIWKRKKKIKESEDTLQKVEIKELPADTVSPEKKETKEISQEIQVNNVSSENMEKEETSQKITTDNPSSVTAIEESPAKEQPEQEEPISEKMPEFERPEIAQEDMNSGVILLGKKISGFMGKVFWGALSIAILPPLFAFTFGILTIVFMLIFPILGVILVASIPVVLVTLFIFLIAIPILFPLLVVFVLITGKGKLLIGSEGKWIGIEIFGKSYSLK
ncbi:MAG: hypothetical protein JETT_1078 [Candidatus Jettenia ecosi]|uniref:Uncharacterized protein n=1 Tax=Candidatus Jettenia ecosi TaxID=2494326 RepID=A0A533QD50_9BACT|nr:MAG: hypothetical protein JETT_1078 [Candidatus Jettenia ecosi]